MNILNRLFTRRTPIKFRLLALKAVCLLLFVVFLPGCKTTEKRLVIEQSLNNGWQFSVADSNSFLPATVPGTIHSDLLNNGLISDPFYGCNEKDLQWIGEKDWVYQMTFDVNPEIAARRQVKLVFEGLDTFAEVFLNGQLLLETNNMFRSWEVNCKSHLKEKNNLLEIRFSSAYQQFKADSIAHGSILPGGKWMFARKAAYHFGWDWGPAFITAGIWKNVQLKGWDDLFPIDAFVATEKISKEVAKLKLHLSLDTEKQKNVNIELKDVSTDTIVFQQLMELEPGLNDYAFDFEIHQPKLWWSNGLGEPNLYHWQIEIKTTDGKIYQHNIDCGIRTIELVQKPDETGVSFYFKLNGVALYAKGANYIPQNSFVTEVADKSYVSLINAAKASNMNFLRVWGGGIYEKDDFYSLCDQNGLLVWQDFMFACAMYPGDSVFLQNVQEEAIEHVKRLRKHPSIALWCGNNEVDEAWHNWGWQQQYKMTVGLQDSIWKSYKDVFHQVLPKVVATYSPHTAYVASSPQIGWGHKESMTQGDSHYWGVWWGKEPFEKYLKKVPRFMSEFGFQAMPALATIRTFQSKAEDSLFSPALRCHQKHPTGFETISTYLDREELKPQTLEEYIFASQIIQAQGIGMAIEAQRRSKPHCMGSLYWQLNDVWPVTSWSGIDFQNNWKALQYRIKEVFEDVLVSAIQQNGNIELSLISDKLEDVNGTFTVDLTQFDGTKKRLLEQKITLLSGKVLRFQPLKINDLVLQHNQSFIEVHFITNDGRVYSDYQMLSPLGQLQLLPSEVNIEVEPITDGYVLKLFAQTFTAFVQLYLSESNARFSDNFFHLQAGETREIRCTTSLNQQDFEKQFQYFHLNHWIEKYKAVIPQK